MSVYRNQGPDGASFWVVDFTWKDASGRKRRIRRNSPLQTRRGAEAYEREVRNALQAGTFETEVAAITLQSFQERYFREHVAKLKASSRSSQATIWRVSLLPTLGEVPLSDIDAAKLAKLASSMQERGSSPKTVNNALSALRTALTCARDWGLVESVPAVPWRKVAAQKFDFLTFEEADQLVEAAGAEPLGPMVVVAMRTGLRLGELLALRWSDVSTERRQLVVARSVWWDASGAHEAGTKSGKVRTVPLSERALAALEYMPRRSSYVFTGDGGQPLTKNACKHPLWRSCERAGLRRIGWHVLRHTFCSHLAMRAVPIPAIQQLAGHATITMTMRYAHMQPDHLRSAIDALE